MDKVNVNDRITFIDTGEIKDGTIKTVIPSKILKTSQYWSLTEDLREDMTTYAIVAWDDGTESKQDISYFLKEDSPLERQFRLAVKKADEEISQKLQIAMVALGEAIDLSEKYGVPFNSGISFLAQSYRPSTLKSKFPDLDNVFISNVSDSYNEYDGWEHSEVC